MLMAPESNKYQAVIFHDYFAINGGGEKLVQTLAEALDTEIYGGFVTANFQRYGGDNKTNIHSLGARQGFVPLQILSLIYHWRHMPQRPQSRQIIYSGVYAPLAVHQFGDRHNILYCHTPPRFIYDQRQFYLQQLSLPQQWLFHTLSHYFRQHYETAVQQMDIIIANSRHIQQRIQHYLGMKAKVIYPPCDTQAFQFDDSEDYYLSTARLDKLKRIDIIIQAFKQMPDKKLIVCSGGPELPALQRLARDHDNIHFTGWLSHKRLSALINRCLATIYIPKNEDFGISPIESMAAGKPVIGVNEGGLRETLIDEQTGFLMDYENEQQLTQRLVQTVQQLDRQRALQMRRACEQRAQDFSRQKFIDNMQALLRCTQ